MNKVLKKLLAAARAEGYEGDIKGLKAWLEEAESTGTKIVVTDDGGKAIDLDALFAAKTVYVTADAKEDVQFVESEDSEDKSEEDDDSEKMDEEEDGEKRWDRKRFHRESGRKNKVYEVDGKNYMGGKGPHIRSDHARAVKAYNLKANHAGVGKSETQTAFSDGDTAREFLAWSRLQLAGDNTYGEKAADIDCLKSYGYKASTVTDLSRAGALVPEEFSTDIIYLVTQYGVARKVAGITPMSSETLKLIRSNDGTSFTINGEAVTITETNVDVDNPLLVAMELGALNSASRALFQSSSISYADMIAREFAQQRAYLEDMIYFRGDGTADYGSVTGVVNSLTGLSTNPEDSAGVILTASAWSGVTSSHMKKALGAVQHINTAEPVKICCPKSFYFEALVPLMEGNLGTTTADASASVGLSGGGNGADARYFGYDVYFTEVLSKTESTDEVPCVMGYFGEGTKFGEVQGSMEFATSEHRYFDSNRVAFRSTQRNAINIHDVGSASTAGPITALIMA